MKVKENGHTIIIKNTEGNVKTFLEKVTNQYASFKNHNLILDITHDKTTDINGIKMFSELSKKYLKAKKSFVIVANNIDFNSIPSSITVVPSLLEANDIIQMEEIERDLGF